MLRGQPALSRFRLDKLNAWLSMAGCKARVRAADHVHVIDCAGVVLDAAQRQRLALLLDDNGEFDVLPRDSRVQWVVPRLGTISPWSSKATDILAHCGMDTVRRIERGHGSSYSVNGRDIRARDVQTLFADAATGSRSTALVSQGRIGALINAKAADRRTIIDEAAGITGLYARRHEAELRLRAAEANLARVQDVLVALEEQHKGLKRQARQASRYRNLSDHIRRAEAAVLALRLAKAEAELADAGERLKEAEAQVADLTRLVGLATTAQAEAATALSQLDLLISIDAPVAHLSAAMGVPTWVLLPSISDWRWRLGGTRAPWYPSARLFQQPKAGDWESVFSAVRSELDLLKR